MVVLAPLVLSNPAVRRDYAVGPGRGETRRRGPQEWSWGGQWPSGLLLRAFRVSSFLHCLRGLYWARWIADNYAICCSRVCEAWPVLYYTIREENVNLVAAWLSAFAGVFPISPMIPAELGRGG